MKSLARPSRSEIVVPGVLIGLHLLNWLFTEGLNPLMVLASVLVGIALCWRRIYSFAATVVIAAVVGVLIAAGFDELFLLTIAEIVAIFAIAIHRSAKTALGGVAIVLVTRSTASIVHSGMSWVTFAEFVVYLTIFVAVWVFGRARRRYLVRLRSAALKSTVDDAGRATSDERERLARELHDAVAGPLSGVVIEARLAARRPDRAGQALQTALSSGRETLTALNDVLDGLGTKGTNAALPDLVAQIVDSFAALDLDARTVLSGIPRPLPGAVVDTAAKILSEALTNAVRYAPGAAVFIGLSYRDDSIELRVDNDSGGTHDFALGSGGGLQGARTRAELIGGTLEAGPHDDGWSVRAVLPTTDPDLATRSRRRWIHGPDGVLALAAVGLPIAAGLFESGVDNPFDSGLSKSAVLIAILTLHGAPLWWRRRAPWLTVLAMLAAMGLWWVADHTGAVDDGLWLLQACWWAQLAAVYAVAAYRRPAWLTWLAALAVGATAGLVVAADTLTDVDIPVADRGVDALGGGLIVGGFLAIPALIAWAAGLVVRMIRRRRVRKRAAELQAAAERVMLARDDERRRISEGVRDSVIVHIHRLVAAAEREAGRTDSQDLLSEALTEARSALTSMREVLRALRVEPSEADSPTIAGIEARCRHAGVAFVRQGQVRRLPDEVDVGAHRMVVALLGARPTAVTIVYGSDGIRAMVGGIAAMPARQTLSDVHDHIDAIGGTISTDMDAAGLISVTVWLPTPEVELSRRE